MPTHADKLKAIQEADIYAKGPAYVELWEIIQEQSQRIKELEQQVKGKNTD